MNRQVSKGKWYKHFLAGRGQWTTKLPCYPKFFSNVILFICSKTMDVHCSLNFDWLVKISNFQTELCSSNKIPYIFVMIFYIHLLIFCKAMENTDNFAVTNRFVFREKEVDSQQLNSIPVFIIFLLNISCLTFIYFFDQIF